ncbi:MAG: hypothetical protein AAF213_09655 [Pseudomonadota bacterium]
MGQAFFDQTTKPSAPQQTRATVLEINDDAVGLLVDHPDGYHFDATNPALLAWHGHVFATIGEAQKILGHALERANDP